MIAIRPPVPDDAEGIARVHVLAWQRGYEHIVGAEALAAITVEQRRAFWDRVLARPDPAVPHWVATIDGTIVGFAAAGPDREGEGVGELWVLNVDPARWRSGIGRALHDEALAWLRSAFDVAVLWVAERNERGRAFYEALGWHADGGRKDELLFGIAFDEVRYRIDLASGAARARLA